MTAFSSAARDRERLLTFTASVVLVVVAIWWDQRDIHLTYAWDGFSPMQWVYRNAFPAQFAQDFPSGVRQYSRSAFMQLYPLLYAWAGVTPDAALPWVIGLEVVLVAAGVWWLQRTLFPQAHGAVFVILLALILASSARNMSLGRWAQPFFVGLFYNAADVCCLLSIAALARHRYVLSAIAAAATVLVHPAIGVFCALMLLGMTGAALRKVIASRAAWLAAGLYAALAGGALLIGYQDVWLRADVVPAPEWYWWTLLHSVHWYPLEFGFFTSGYRYGFIQFVSFTIVLLLVLRQKGRTETDRMVMGGLALLAVAAAAGIALSIIRPSPFWTKLSLHRASDLFILVGLFYVANGLWRLTQDGTRWERLLAWALLASPFLDGAQYPIAASVALVVASAWRQRRAFLSDGLGRALTVMVPIVLAYFLWLRAEEFAAFRHAVPDVFDAARRWPFPVLALMAPATVALAASAVWPRLREHAGMVAAPAMIVLAIGWQLTHRLPDPIRARDGQYLAAQAWAREHSEPTALFMTDPTFAYSWRDYSRRSSFGTFREWTFASWAYDSSRPVFDEGMKRFAEFGVDVSALYQHDAPHRTYAIVERELDRRYYQADERWFERMAAVYGIDYVVFDRQRLTRDLRLPIVFENEAFQIRALPRR